MTAIELVDASLAVSRLKLHTPTIDMSITLTTPALLFPTISLLLLAYTNRFLALAQLVRGLRQRYAEAPHPSVLGQIHNLRRRLVLIRNMQWLASIALLLSVVCMFLLFAGEARAGQWIFGVSLVCLIGSLAVSVYEIQISIDALVLELGNAANMPPTSQPR